MLRRNFLKVSLPLSLSGHSVAALSESPCLRFGVVADPQYADFPAAGTRFYRNSLTKLTAAVTEFNRHPLDFVVTLGDMIDRDFQSFSKILPIYQSLKCPHIAILGNHDFEVADEDKSKVMRVLGREKAYESWQICGWRLLFLDGTDLALWRYPAADARTLLARSEYELLRSKAVPQAQPWNAGMGKTQLLWLENEIKQAADQGQKVIAFNHYPIFPDGSTYNLWNADPLRALINPYPHFVAWMNGHNHAGNYSQQGSCHHLNFKGMVESAQQNAFSIVECFSDRLQIIAFGAEQARICSF